MNLNEFDNKKEIFRGVGTALITPFKRGKIDYKDLEALLERQIKAGVGAVVIGGTTGEAATLEDGERYELYRATRAIVTGRCKIVFGTGTNDTRVAIKHTEMAEKVGCDGVLLVTPYYNKGTREGLYRHYKAIAECTALPIMLYNVPSRTGVDLSLELLSELSKIENIVAIKEASGRAERLAELSMLPLGLYAGNDAETYSVLSLGGLGVVSVVSNLYPEACVELCNLFFTGEVEKSLKIQKKLLPVINSLFIETNPAPIKYAMSRAGLCDGEMRLPMWLPTEATRRKIDKVIEVYEADGC